MTSFCSRWSESYAFQLRHPAQDLKKIKFIGLFTVTKVISPCSVRLLLPFSICHINPAFHRSDPWYPVHWPLPTPIPCIFLPLFPSGSMMERSFHAQNTLEEHDDKEETQNIWLTRRGMDKGGDMFILDLSFCIELLGLSDCTVCWSIQLLLSNKGCCNRNLPGVVSHHH